MLLITLLLWTSLRLVGLSAVLAGSLESLTGREVTIRGSTHLRFGRRPGLRVEELEIGPAPGSVLRHLAADRLAVTFAWRPLLRGDFGPRELELEGVKVALESGVSTTAGPERAPPTSARSLSLERVDAKALTVEFRPGPGEPATVAELRSVSLRTAGGTGNDPSREFRAAGALEQIHFDLSGRVAQRESGTDLRAVALEGRIAGAEVGGKGTLRFRAGTPVVALQLEVRAEHLGLIGATVGREFPELGPLLASGHLTVDGDTVGVSDLKLQVGDRESAWLTLEGNVGDLRKQRDYGLHADFGFSDVRLLRPWVGDPPHIGKVVGKATLRNVKGRSDVEEFSLQGGLPGLFEVDAEGYLHDIRGVEDLDARVDLKARDLAVIGELFRLSLPAVGPVEVSGQVKGDTGKFNSQHMRVDLGETHLSGTVSGRVPAEGHPRLDATVDVPALHLGDFYLEARSAPETSGPPSPPAKRLFADHRIDFSALQKADGTLAARVEHVTGREGPLLQQLQLDATLAAGELTVKHLAFTFDGGRIAGEVALDTRATPVAATARAEAKGIRLGALMSRLGQHTSYIGNLDAQLDLSSRGDSLHAWVSGATGEAEVVGENATIEIQHAGILTRDLVQTVRREFLGFLRGRKSSRSITVNCMIAHLVIRNGVAEPQPLLLDTENSTIIGQGSVDFGAERIDLRLIPRTHRSGLLSVTPTVRVVGPLWNPAVKTEKMSLATSAARALADSATRLSGAQAAMRTLGLTAGRGSPCEAAFSSR